MKRNRVAIGTRGSKLALWQAEWVKSELNRLYPDLEVELIKIKTTGDKILDVPLAQVGGKGLFVKEIEESLLRHESDIAVHSMKDVPTDFPEGLHLAVVCKREDPRDAFISKIRNSEFKFQKFRDLSKGAKVGTSSLRRSCQLLNIRPDIRVEQLRGNLDTRLRKLDEGQFDAIILAAAGVKRLGLHHRITEILDFDVSLPAIGQGAVGIECRTEDGFINKLIAPLGHPETFICVKAERAFLKRLEGGCQVPIAAYARIIRQKSEARNQKSNPPSPPFSKGGQGGINQIYDINHQSILVMDGLVGSITGDTVIKAHIEGNPDQAEHLGSEIAEDILSRGAKAILDEVYGRGILEVNGEISS